MKSILWVAGLFLAVNLGAVESRFPDVLYLDEIGEKLPVMRTTRTAGLSSSPDMKNVLWTLFANQSVQLIGYYPGVYYVETKVSTGTARGWVEAGAIEAISPSTIAEWQKKLVRIREHRTMIAAHKIGIGFTTDEAQAAMGKPDRVATVTTTSGRQETWTYSLMSPIPFYEYYISVDGRTVITNSYAQPMQVGTRTVLFLDGVVVEYREDTPSFDHGPRPIFKGYLRY